jgi:hypothetical protein
MSIYKMRKVAKTCSILLLSLSASSFLVNVNCFNLDRELQNFDQSLSSLDEPTNNKGDGRSSKCKAH